HLRPGPCVRETRRASLGGGEVRQVGRDAAHVRALPGRERAGERLDSERAGRPDRGELERQPGRAECRVAQHCLLQQHRELHALEEILAIVAGGTVNAEADDPARREERSEAADPVPEIGVTRGVVRYRYPMTSQTGEVSLGRLDAVHRQEVRPEPSEPFQVLDRRTAMMGARIVYLGGTRREMEGHPPIVCPGPALEGAQHRLAAPLDAEWLDPGAHPFRGPPRPATPPI